MSRRKRRNRKRSEDLLNDIDLKMTREALHRARKRKTNYIA
ncbi:MAG: hypothetical protein NWE77_02710 [Candidatus Bathyarchaeota archaeon]|nr:hypothetical protein [Candidatus Bathyarchaeota archaeon]